MTRPATPNADAALQRPRPGQKGPARACRLPAQCPQPLSIRDPQFYACYSALGDFPEVNVGGKWLLVRMLTAFGAGLVPIL